MVGPRIIGFMAGTTGEAETAEDGRVLGGILMQKGEREYAR